MFDPIKIRLYKEDQGIGWAHKYLVQVRYSYWPFWMTDNGVNNDRSITCAMARYDELLEHIKNIKTRKSEVLKEEAV